ncbi:MAG: hypothetical protein KDK99_04020 [Verrucomicrobiales bacterium]|nr:hypothetical protein [Verrucomicrobiales bacterium]
MTSLNLAIDTQTLTAKGLHLQGSIPATGLELPDESGVHPAGDTTVDLKIHATEQDLIATGSIVSPFELECVRCLRVFPQEVRLEDWSLKLPLKKGEIIDLTEPIREDILLALPSYPRCEDGNVEPGPCPAEGRFDPVEQTPLEDRPDQGDTGAWDILDELNR